MFPIQKTAKKRALFTTCRASKNAPFAPQHSIAHTHTRTCTLTACARSYFQCFHAKKLSAGAMPLVLESLSSHDIHAKLTAIQVLQQLLYLGTSIGPKNCCLYIPITPLYLGAMRLEKNLLFVHIHNTYSISHNLYETTNSF